MIRRLGLAVVVAGLTALAVAGRADEGLTRLVLLSHSAMGVAALVLTVRSRDRLRRAMERARGATPVVATGLIEAPPLDVAQLMSEVRSLGFELAGATDTVLLDRPIRTWGLVEQSGEAWVEIGIGLRPMAIFLSEVAAGKLIETAYPEPVTAIDDPRLRARGVSTSAADALAEHRAAVAAAGGSRRHVATLDDYLAAERDQRERTGGMRIRAYLDSVIDPSIRDWTISVVVDAMAFLALTFLGPTARG
jgi:hypothetical protein